jgi:predicted DCC family thiol-disulfide oxidoreductase YuxK
MTAICPPILVSLTGAADQVQRSWGKKMRHVILFDGMCILCDKGVAFTVSRYSQEDVRISALQSVEGQRLARAAGVDPKRTDTMVVICEDGTIHTGSDAMLRMCRLLGGGWSLFRPLEIIPRTVRDFVYRPFASRRHWLFGRRDSCAVPTGKFAPFWLRADEVDCWEGAIAARKRAAHEG